MWNWAAAVLSVEGAALVAFDGSPGHPDLAALWKVSAEEGVTHLGASPKYVSTRERVPIIFVFFLIFVRTYPILCACSCVSSEMM